MNTKMIISELMDYKKIKTKRQLAAFLEVSEQNLADWIRRNSPNIKIICNKLPEIDANWLITGEGEMLKQTTKTGGNAQGEGAMNHSNSNIIIEKFLDEIAQQRKLTQSVIEQNNQLLRIIESK